VVGGSIIFDSFGVPSTSRIISTVLNKQTGCYCESFLCREVNSSGKEAHIKNDLNSFEEKNQIATMKHFDAEK
jgi:hypothetical protein